RADWRSGTFFLGRTAFQLDDRSVQAPRDTPPETIAIVVRRKTQCVLRRLADFAEMSAALPAREFVSGTEPTCLGIIHRIGKSAVAARGPVAPSSPGRS